ncbi:MAG: aminopeptidase N [Nitriliruptoraceae bacterium]
MSPATVRENLTDDEATERSRRLYVSRTRVHLDLTGGEERFESTAELDFGVEEAGSTFVDCTAAEIHRIELDGDELPLDVAEPTRIHLPSLAPGEHHLRVQASMEYQHEGNGLHRFVDPVDERVYLHSQFQPFDAHLVYACFDQPDLKTVFELSVDAPADWIVVSNAEPTSQPPPEAAGRWMFAAIGPISPYITAVVAGAYVSRFERYERADGTGIDLGFHVRRSLAEHLDVEELAQVTRQGFDAFEHHFGQHYPFGERYDQLFVPEFSAGAMENPGCVTFTEAYVFRSKVTDAIRERRAETILHEMAHMWFGDLVTMRWWDDLWLNESFATFMAALVQASATRWRDAWVTFLDAEKAWAKYQDQLPSTHPVADAMPDVESVHQNFDGITYAKGASVLRQLVAWVGQEAFLAGCRDYFARHAWGNTTLADFLAALERSSGRELAGWRDEWLLTTGVNRLSVEVDLAADGTYERVELVQSSPSPAWAELPGVDPGPMPLRRHRVAVGCYRRTERGMVRDQRVELDVIGERTEIEDLRGVAATEVLLVNDDDLTYAKLALDAASMEVVADELASFGDPLARAQLWSATWDMVRDAELPARRFVELVVRNVAAEPEVGVLQRLLQRAVAAVERYGDPRGVTDRLAELAAAARVQMDQARPGSDHQLAWVRHWATVARADEDQLDDLLRLLEGELTLPGLEVDTDLRWHLLIQLARAGACDDARITKELERDPTDLGERQAATARAARPDPAAKQAAWDRLLHEPGLSHTLSRQLWSGFAQLDQREVLDGFTERYFAALDEVWRERSLDWAISFSTAMFPHWAADARLLDRVDQLLTSEELSRPLRRVLLEQRDTLARTLKARSVDAGSVSN